MNASEHGVSAAGNTDNPCLLILRDAGYDLWLEPREQASQLGPLWCASKNDVHFMGHSGAELLGIVTLWEHFGPDWNRQNPSVLDELFDDMDDIDET